MENMETWMIVLIVVGVIGVILAVLRQTGDTRVEIPSGIGGPGAPSGGGSLFKKREAVEREQWRGGYMGTEYVVEQLEGGAMTVYIDLPGGAKEGYEISAREGEEPKIPEIAAAGDIRALIDLGAEYIEMNYSASWVAAVVPFRRAVVDRVLAERIVANLIRIRDFLKRSGQGPE